MNIYLQYVGGIYGATAIASIVTAATAVYYYLSSKSNIDKHTIPLHEQSIVIINGIERIHVSKFNESNPDTCIAYLTEDAQTLFETFRKGVQASNNRPCLGWRENLQSPYKWITYNETLLKAKHFGSGLIALGMKPYDFLGIYSQNCPEWIISELGAYSYSMTIVPLYDTLGSDACSNILNTTKISTLIVEDDVKITLILANKVPPSLKKIISIKSVNLAIKDHAKMIDIDVYSFVEIEKLGAQNLINEIPPKPNDICTICFTSGTTGNPKGVMISHKNIVANMVGTLYQVGKHRSNINDISISYLPLAHMLERIFENVMLYSGSAIGFFSGDIKELMNDIKVLRPTIMPIVPRLLNRLYDKVQNDISNSMCKRILFNLAMQFKQNELSNGVVRNNSIWDWLVFGKIQAAFGGNIRAIICGSAPLSGSVLKFSRCALGCLIIEGYGQTECVAPTTLTLPDDMIPEHVGPPLPCCCMKLIDVPEMDYYAKHNKGEICIKGPNVCHGYYNDPEKTAEIIDTDGWLHSGDIGMWLPNGTLKIIDRRKEIFKLSQGEYIAPEKIENVYVRSKFVEQVFVYGESLKSCLVSIVVPDETVLCKYCSDENYTFSNHLEMCKSKKIKKILLDDMIKSGKEAGLKSFEQIKDIYLHPELLSIQNEMLTPTLKLRRPQLKAFFKLQLEEMYKHLD